MSALTMRDVGFFWAGWWVGVFTVLYGLGVA